MKRKAFTLTELLVVVIITSVLAAIVLPKFRNVLETRKTTEAENIMTAVRDEQEARCTLGKNYLGPDKSDLVTMLPKKQGKNYTFTLEEAGIKADSLSEDYTLSVLSYADGRICCSGGYCNQLNKDYPTCEELRTRGDFVATKDCTTEPVLSPVPPPPPGPTGCPQPPPAEEQLCDQEGGLCGKRTRTVTCDESTGRWIVGAWEGNCKEKPSTGKCYGKMWCPNGFPFVCDLEKGWLIDKDGLIGCTTGQNISYKACTTEPLCHSGWLGYSVGSYCDEASGWITGNEAPYCISNTGFLCECMCNRNRNAKYDRDTGQCTCPNGTIHVLNYEPDKLLWRMPPSSHDVADRQVDVSWTLENQQLKLTKEEREELLEWMMSLDNASIKSKEEYCQGIQQKYGAQGLKESFPECF